jgi:hypothetical protein
MSLIQAFPPARTIGRINNRKLTFRCAALPSTRAAITWHYRGERRLLYSEAPTPSPCCRQQGPTALLAKRILSPPTVDSNLG